MIDIREFERRYKLFERVEFKEHPHTFHEFWLYKLEIESKDVHILDREHRDITLSKLGGILRIWKWNRPYKFEDCFQKLEKSLDKISDSYNRIRNYSLIEFNKIPEKELKNIWYEFGSIKEEQETSNNYGGELVMPITKPLMILWGQTPAFDQVIRTNLRLFNYKEFIQQRWEFSFWIHIMRELQRYLNHNTELLTAFRRISKEKYGTDYIVPFGRFFDIYYYAPNLPPNSLKTNNSLWTREKQRVKPVMGLQQQEYNELVNLLNKLKRVGKISAIERRNYEKSWRDYPNNRELIMKELELKLAK